MESVLAIGVGLGLRIVVDVATDNDERVGGVFHLLPFNVTYLIPTSGVLVGLWEGVVLNHFVRRMPRSFDPYLGFGFRIFVDFLFTQSLSRLALVVLWALVGMLLADVAPNVWRDSGLRHLYRQVCKDVRHVKRSVPHIRIKNDLPSVRLFNKSRSSSSSVSGSIRSDRAAPSRSPAPSRPSTPGPARRQGPSPPGTFPDVSGWSETGTDISNPRERVIIPGPSPALIPSREHAAYERIDTTHVTTSRSRSTTVQDTTITFTHTQDESVLSDTGINVATLGATAASTSHEPIDDPSRHNPPAIPDDWVDVNHPMTARSNEPVAPFQPDPESTPEPQPGPSTLTQSRPASVLGPLPAIDVLPNIPDVDHVNRASRPAAQIPLPESRAASVIGGVYDQPQPRSALRDSILSRVDKAISEIGVDPAKSLARPVDTQSTKSQSTSRSWTPWGQPKPKDADPPELPPKETQREPVGLRKPDVGGANQGSEPQIFTPAQQDPPTSILTQPGDALPLLFTSEPQSKQQQALPQTSQPDQAPGPSVGVAALPQGKVDKGDTAGPRQTSLFDLSPPTRMPPQGRDALPLLFTSEPQSEQQQAQPQTSQPDQAPRPSVVVDSSAAPPQGRADNGDTVGPRKASLFSLPSPSRTPPPPFTEFAGVPEGPAAGEGPAEEYPVTQDEAPTELTKEQIAAEEKRMAFLLTQVQELEGSRGDLRKKLDREDDPASGPAKAIESDLEDADKTLSSIKARMVKKKFSGESPHFLIQC
jgi:hypothetical protein